MYLYSICRKYFHIALILCLICSSLSSVAQKYDPFDGNSTAFHVQLSRYFKSAEDEKAIRVTIIDSINSFRSDSVWTLNNLRTHLDNYETLLVSIERHEQYLQLRVYTNNKDTSAQQDFNQVEATRRLLMNITNRILLQPVFASITDQQLTQYNLSPYKFMLTQVAQGAKHNLSDHDEQLKGKLGDDMVDHLIDRYDNLMDNIKGDSITIGSKRYNPIAIWSGILLNPDSVLRRKVSTAYYKAYSDHGEVLAATLIDITLQKTALAKIWRYKSSPERTYAGSLQLSEANVKQMLAEMVKHANVLKAYQNLQAEQVKRITGMAVVHSWDASLPMGFTWQPMPFAKVRPLILNALSPLGKEYGQQFAALLDPANGQLDIAGGPNRVTEFTSVGFISVPESLYMKSYDGSLSNVSRLAHEGGHAIHEQLMSNNRIIPSYKAGPSFLYEAYAMLNELLLLDALEKQEKTTKGKTFYTKQFLDKLAREIFISAEEGAFEQKLYEGVASGTINNREDVDSLYAGIMNKYDSYFPSEPQRKSEWIKKRLLYDDPLYNVNYLYAMLVTCKLYQMQHDHPKEFITNYTALLKNGFNTSANDLLKKFMGFDLNNTTLLDGALQLMQKKTAQLKSLYNK